MRLFVAALGHIEDRVHGNADVITRDHLQHDMAVVIIFGTGQDDAVEFSARRFNRSLAPYPDVERLERIERFPFVSFEYIRHVRFPLQQDPSGLSAKCSRQPLFSNNP